MRSVIFILFHIWSSILFAQDCDFTPREIIKQLDSEILLIEPQAYDNVKSIQSEQSSNVLNIKSETYFLENYPNIFNMDSLCYKFYSNDSVYIKACRKNSTFDELEQMNFLFKGQYCNNALIYVSGYEYWGYISVDLSNGEAFYTLGSPLSLDCNTVVSYSNYYLEEEIAITKLDSKKKFVIYIDGWKTIDAKFTRNDFYFKMKPIKNCQDDFKYLKIKLK